MRRWALSLVVGVVGLLLLTAPAAAHGGDPVITVEATHPSDTSVHFIVRMLWENDDDPIDGKTVTATPVDPAGIAGAAVTMTGTGDGNYEGPVEMPTPGTWTVIIASAEPKGSINHTEVRPEPTATTSTTSTTVPDEPTEEQAAADDDQSASSEAGEDDGSSSGSAALVVAAAVVIAVAGGLVAIRIVRKNSASPTPTD